LTLTAYDLDFKSLTSYGMTHTRAKYEAERSVGPKAMEWKQTDGRTDTTDRISGIAFRANAVGKYFLAACRRVSRSGLSLIMRALCGFSAELELRQLTRVTSLLLLAACCRCRRR